MVLALAVTPLSAVLSGGRFETWLPTWDGFDHGSLHVALSDQTGMVRAITPGRSDERDEVENPGGNRYVLEVGWLGGCSDRDVQLSLFASPSGYALTERTFRWGCPLDIGLGRSVAIHFWSPIDAATVTFIPND
jgi:hypothetical protein